jgi:hypothetical protein
MNLFDRANQGLRQDLNAYAQALRTIVVTLPRARELCDRVVKETRLARALLAFSDSQQMTELSQLAFHLTNLWPYRENSFARTIGFAEEIEEARRQRDEALRGVKALARLNGDPLTKEISTSFGNIASYMEQERTLLAECDALIKPHASNRDLTRKRLNLLVAMVDARVPESAEQAAMLAAYQEAAALLRDWESGVPLEERGVAILERCVEMLNQAAALLGTAEDEEYLDC